MRIGKFKKAHKNYKIQHIRWNEMHNNNQEMKYLYMPDHTPHKKEQN